MSGRQDVTRRIEPGLLEVDVENSALVINFSVSAEVVDGTGKVLKSKTEDKQKVLPLEVDEHTDLDELAEHIVATQKYVPAQKLPRVIKLLEQLQEHNIKSARRKSSSRRSKHDKKKSSKKSSKSRSKKESGGGGGDEDKHDGEGKEAEGSDGADGNGGAAAAKKELVCSLDELDEYLDNLYSEDYKVKSMGVRKILQLAKNDPTVLEDFIENEPLIGALSRVLQDDYKQNIELTLPLCTLFCIFSKFSDMHFVLRGKGVGTMGIKIVELELNRYDMRSKKMRDYRRAVEAGKKDQAFLDGEEAKTLDWLRKQENLLCMCVRMLLNLSEDVDVERKMAQKTDMLKYLVALLGRNNAELLKIAMVFLKKLCIVLENSIKLTDLGIVKALMPYVPCRSDPYIGYNALKLLYNLSFSPLVRKQVAELDGVKNVVAYLPNTRTRNTALKVLYNLSSDSQCRASFAASECLTSAIKLCIMNKAPQVPGPLGALCVNLLLDPANAQKVCNSKAHPALMKKLLETKDLYLAKCAKVLALYTYRVQEALGDDDEYQEIEIWGSWIKELFAMAMEIHQDRGSSELLTEVLATLSNMSPDDLPEDTMWKDLLTMGRCQVLEFMEELCDSRIPSARPDVVMQAICCIGAFALEPDVCAYLAEHRPRLFRLLQLDMYFYTEDAGMTLQILFVLYRLLRFQEVCVEMLSLNSNSFSAADIQKFVSATGGFVQHPHPEIRRAAHALLDLVMEFDSVQGTGQLFSLAREVKFAAQNQDWIEIMEEINQNKRFVIEERGTVVNDGEDDDMSSDDGSGHDYVDAAADSGDYAEYMDNGAVSPSGSEGLYQDEGKYGGGGHGK